ncbi:MAG: arylsulfotransferase family protein, partial [Myxococcota bacterium]
MAVGAGLLVRLLRTAPRLRDTQVQMSPLTRRSLLSASAIALLGVGLVGGFVWGFQAHRSRVFPYAVIKSVVTGQGPAAAPDTPGRWRLRDGRRPWILEDPTAFTQKALEELGYAQGTVMAPDASGVVVNSKGAHAGLNLVTSGDSATARLMAMDGSIVHEWKTSWEQVFPQQVGQQKPPRPYLRRARLLPDGHLLSLFVDKGAFRLDRQGQVVWAWTGGAHHDLALQDDAVWVLARDPELRPEVDPHTPMIDDALVRLDPNTGALRQRFTIWQAVEDSAYAPLLKKVRMRGDADPLHSNTVRILDGRFESVNPAFSRGNLLVSVRHTDWVLVIDPRLQRVVWALTGPWHQPHEPTLVEPGHLLIFDNLGTWPR